MHSNTTLGHKTISGDKSGPNLNRNYSVMDVNIGDIDDLSLGNNMLSLLPDIKKFNDVKRVTPVDNLVSEHQFSLAVSNPQRAMIEDDLLEFELLEKAKQEFGELDINGGDDLGEPFTPILA